MVRYRIVAYFAKGYIANPYWAEREKVINIQKSSGVNRARSAASRRKAMQEYLSSIGTQRRSRVPGSRVCHL